MQKLLMCMLCVAGLAATGSEKLEMLRNYERNISDFSTRHVALAPADARWENTGKSFRIHWKDALLLSRKTSKF